MKTLKTRTERAKWLKAIPTDYGFGPKRMRFKPNIFANLIDMCIRFRRVRFKSLAAGIMPVPMQEKGISPLKVRQLANSAARIERDKKIKERRAVKAALVKPVFA